MFNLKWVWKKVEIKWAQTIFLMHTTCFWNKICNNIWVVKKLTCAFSFFPCNEEQRHFCYQKVWCIDRAPQWAMVVRPWETLKKLHSLDIHQHCFPQLDLRKKYSSVAFHNKGLVRFCSFLSSRQMQRYCVQVGLDLLVRWKTPKHNNKNKLYL